MNQARIEITAEGVVAVTGALDYQTVPALLKQSYGIIFNDNSGVDLIIDLSAVSRTESAGVALLIEWTRQAKKFNKTLHFKNIPQQMHEIAEVTGVDKMLAI